MFDQCSCGELSGWSLKTQQPMRNIHGRIVLNLKTFFKETKALEIFIHNECNMKKQTETTICDDFEYMWRVFKYSLCSCNSLIRVIR